MLNPTQINLFKDLTIDIKKSNIDIKKIEEVRTLGHFKIWQKIINQLYGKLIIPEENKTLDQTIDYAIQDLVIEYFNRCTKTFQKRIVEELFENYNYYLKNDQKTFFYFSPLYNFEFDSNEIQLEESIKIRKISKNEKEFLLKFYNNFSPVKISINKIKFVFILKSSGDGDDPLSTPEKQLFHMLNKFKILNNGNICLGGLYYFDKSDNWNPKNKIDRIKVEPIGILSTKKYVLHKKYSEKFKELIIKISKQYPDKTQSNLEFYDVLDRTIHRFSNALEKNDVSEKIVDLVLCLEILLVSASYDSSMKLSQRTALFIGKNVKERLYILEHMVDFYSFRSGQVHEFKDRPLKKDMTKDFVLKKLELWTRRSILQMIFFSQEKKFSKSTFRQLLKKIDHSAYDPKLNTIMQNLSNEIIKILKF